MKITQANILPTEELKEVKPHNFRVMVVDDDIACAQTMVWILEMIGQSHAQMAHEGMAAIALAKSFCPEVVLLDIGLPGMNGYEICSELQKNPALANTTFIAQTGWGQREHKERTKEAGFHYHLVKPVDIEALKDIFLGLDKARLQTT